jgi:hypothetical protein
LVSKSTNQVEETNDGSIQTKRGFFSYRLVQRQAIHQFRGPINVDGRLGFVYSATTSNLTPPSGG